MKIFIVTLLLLLSGCAVTQPSSVSEVYTQPSAVEMVMGIAQRCPGAVQLRAAVINDKARAEVQCSWVVQEEVW